MFRKYCIISLRKLKRRTPVYLVNVAVSSVGYTCLLSSFFLFRMHGHVSAIMLGAALVIFLSNSINNISFKFAIKEVSIRKLLGAGTWGIYSLILVESLLLSFAAALISLIILDLQTFGHAFIYSLDYRTPDANDLMFLFLSVIIISLLTGLLPTYRLSKVNLAKRFRNN